jgi:hypothetical protein
MCGQLHISARAVKPFVIKLLSVPLTQHIFEMRKCFTSIIGQVIRLQKPKMAPTLPQVPSEWIETGKAVQRIQLSRFCDEPLLLSLLERRKFLATSGASLAAVEQHFGCFQVGETVVLALLWEVFSSVAAKKLQCTCHYT